MKICIKYRWLFIGWLMIFSHSVNAQAQSTTIDNGYRTTGSSDSTFEFSQNLYIGPNAQWEINGVHVVYSIRIWIAPSAQITGTGKLIIANPSANLFYIISNQSTTIDGNNSNFIDLNIEHNNPSNIVLNNISDPGFSTTNPSGALSAALKIGKNFSFHVDDGDVILNGNDFVFDENATHSNAGVNRMVVTSNSVIGHMVKENNISTSFVFPVGIAEGDFTPATITGDNRYNVSVLNYNVSNPIVSPDNIEKGMYRTWHLFGGAATSVRLQHNASTNGADYVDEEAFISRYLGISNWTSGIPEQISVGIHENENTIPTNIPETASALGSYLTKLNNPIILPITLIAFNALKKENTALLEWSTSSEKNSKGFEIERSRDGINWMTIGYVSSLAINGNSNIELSYLYKDDHPNIGTNYYRLKHVDHNGKVDFSSMKLLTFDELFNISLFPNPTATIINIAGLQGNETINLYDISGKKLKVFSVERNTFQINVSPLNKGAYFIQVININGSSQNFKFIKE